MRSILYISIFTALLSLCLTIAAAIHISFQTGSAVEIVKYVDDHYIDHSSLTTEQSHRLARCLQRLGGGEAYLLNLHHDLWQLSVIGFGVITLLSGLIAVLAFRANPSFKRDELKRAP